jgi:GTP-binding protein
MTIRAGDQREAELGCASPLGSCALCQPRRVRVSATLAAGLAAGAAHGQRVPTATLNVAMQRALATHGPPSVGGRRLKLLYVTQAAVRPPTFVLFVNDAGLLHFSYQRYLENSIRRAFGFQGTALKLIFRGREEKE